MKNVFLTILSMSLLNSIAQAQERESYTVGLQGGIGPAESLSTKHFAGGWLGLRLAGAWKLELSGSYQGTFGEDDRLRTFLLEESLLEPDNVLADEVNWTAEAAFRVEALRGKWAFLQSTGGGWAGHYGFGVGARGYQDDEANLHIAPTGLLVAGVDLFLNGWLLVRLDSRFFGQLRRDNSIGMGAELAIGIGVHR